MAKGCSNYLIKYILFAFNFIFVVIGATILGFGIYLLTKSTDLKQLMDTPDLGSIIVIITGACVFLISFFGCFGALKENDCMLKTYCIVVGILAIIQLITTCLVILYNTKIDDIVDHQLKKAFDDYKAYAYEGDVKSSAIDFLQWSLGCCGYDGFEYWSQSGKYPAGSTPASCCRNPNDAGDQRECTSQKILFYEGCKEKVENFLKNSFTFVICTNIFISIIELLAACFACVLSNAS